MAKYKNFLGLGIAGNFALHLAQAGELEDFKDVVTADEAAPKGIFPFYLPRPHNPVEAAQQKANKTLHTYPLSSENIKLPLQKVNVQAEPEVALICDIEYKSGKVSAIKPRYFAAYNDVSLRVEGAEKISEKKNWGHETKGLSNGLFKIDKFEEGGIMDSFRICSFLRRNGELKAYGEDVALTGYSYFHEQLTDWLVEQINTQEEFGPLEAIQSYIEACENPTQAIISIGATRYTEFGERGFLELGDEVIVILYNAEKLSSKELLYAVETESYDTTTMSILVQKVINQNSNE